MPRCSERQIDAQLHLLAQALALAARAVAPPRAGGRRRTARRVAGWGSLSALLGLAVLLALSGGYGPPPEPGPRELIRADRLPTDRALTLSELQGRFASGQPHFTAQGIRFRREVKITLPRVRRIGRMTIALYHSGIYRITLALGGAEATSFLLGPRMLPIGLCSYTVEVCGAQRGCEIDTITVTGVDDNYFFELGPITFEPESAP